ncbi:MAG: branched-chain amino acid aminotransferase [Clostridia bacterium]|nr:branched-chain amino acid aminotransferase [Clostridia bacterium]
MEKVVGFNYHKTPFRFVSYYRDGQWSEGSLTGEETITLNESACIFQYAQGCFEGLKAYQTVNGEIVCFRPDMNASRMAGSARWMEMPAFPEDRFVEAVVETVRANKEFVPPYGSGGSLYIRPFMIGTNPVLGVKPASEFEFRIFVSPVGAYFSGKSKALSLLVSDYDRAAPHGTGHIKAGLNYAMSLHAYSEAHRLGYDENVYPDAGSRTYVEETGGANILFVTKDGKIVTPKSDSILPSITRRSLLDIARDYLHLEVETRKIRLDELDSFVECGLCGTAAVISPVGKITNHGKVTEFETDEETGYGKILGRLRQTLVDIQLGLEKAPEGWICKICDKD